jgi:curved DNA-binding protein CbpA
LNPIPSTVDCFALLEQPRQPALDLVALEAHFLALARDLHPDRLHAASEADRQSASQRYADLNRARQILREIPSRLLHLLELETGNRPPDIQRIPPGTMDLFVEVGEACRDTDAFLARRTAADAPILKVKLFQEGLQQVERLQALQRRIHDQSAALQSHLPSLSQAWTQAPPPGSPQRPSLLPLARLEELYRAFSYIARWTAQIQERIAHLAAV